MEMYFATQSIKNEIDKIIRESSKNNKTYLVPLKIQKKIVPVTKELPKPQNQKKIRQQKKETTKIEEEKQKQPPPPPVDTEFWNYFDKKASNND
jgi:hypothetical protein